MTKKLIKVQLTGTSFDLKVGEAIVENTSQNINTQTVNVIYEKKVTESQAPTSEVSEIKLTDFRDEVIRIFKDVVLDDKKSVINVLDRSGCVILTAKDLLSLISKLYEVNETDIKINYDEEETGCCFSKIIPIKHVNSIKIMVKNFYNDLQYIDNSKYNLLCDDFKISLSSVVYMSNR
jgi:hypothetical protein